MSLIKLADGKYPIFNRFSRLKQWQKVLFRPDRKSQIAEVNELQSVVNHQQEKAFSYFYFLYSVTRGLKINVISFGDDYIDIQLTGGQIYIETDYGGFFIDIASKNLRLPTEGRHSVGVLVDFNVVSEANELRDPITGGEITGTLGTDRLIANYNIVLNSDTYPIAIVQCKGAFIVPDVFYYRSRDNTTSSTVLSSSFKSNLTRRWYEEAGNFIVEGFDVTFNPSQAILIVHPGVAYVLGERVSIAYPKYIELPFSPLLVQRYLILLNNSGELEIRGDNLVTTNSTESSADLIHLASIDLQFDRNPITSLELKTYTLIKSKNRMPLVSDLLALQAKHEETDRDLLQIALDSSALDVIDNTELVGIFTDALSDLSRSDIYNPLYSATVLPAIRAISLSFIEKRKDLTNLTVTNSKGILTGLKDNNPYYITTNYREGTLLEQAIATDWLALNNQVKTVATMILSPNRTSSDISPVSSLIGYSSLPTLQSNSLKDLTIKSKTKLNIKTSIYTQPVLIECDGFNPDEDNLVLTFGNIRLTQFTILIGAVGSTFSTVKARSDGKVSVRFSIPAAIPDGVYTVTLANSNSYAAGSFTGSNKLDERLAKDVEEYRPPFITSHHYEGILKGIAQSFFINTPVIISSLDLKLRTGPNSITGNFAIATLVKLANGIPTSEVLGKADLDIASIITSNNGQLWSNFTFDKPVYIPSRGEYALVITPLVAGVEIYYANIGSTDLSGTTSSQQININGNLLQYINNVWQADLNKDLAIRLNRCIPTQDHSEIIYKIEDVESFNAVEFDIPFIASSLNNVEFYNKEENVWRLIDKNNFQLQTPSTSAEFKIKLIGNNSSFPLIEADNISFTTLRHNRNSIWISRTIDYIDAYKNLEFTFEAYNPEGTIITPKFSSNAGYSWESLELEDRVLVDGNIPLYSLTYKAFNLSDGVTTNDESVLRKRLTLRIDFQTINRSLIPFVRRLSSIVY